MHPAGTATSRQRYLKVHKHENFFGSDFEFLTFLWLVIPNSYFQEIFFIAPILGKLQTKE
jgi:hypothetical protein